MRPLELVRERGQTMLVVDYTGGEPLDCLIRGPWRSDDFSDSPSRCLPHSVSSTDAGSFTRTSSQPTFSWTPKLAGLAHRLRHCVAPPARAPIARPSRVYRRNARLHGARADGTSESLDRFPQRPLLTWGHFYEMLTGSLPFAASDAMEWVHCHIARQPAAPGRGLQSSSVGLRDHYELLSKTAEERYQTAAGVEHDLQRCLSQWESRGSIDVFTLGAHDTPDRLMIPEKLYGRIAEWTHC